MAPKERKQLTNDLKDRLDAFVESLFIDCQQAFGIKAGDIDPLDQLELDEALETAAETICRVLEYQPR